MIKKIRLTTGLILFVYVASHFLNHALGLISLTVAERGADVFLFFWRGWIGTAALYGALAVHVGLALWSIFMRRTLRMHPWEAAQLLIGLLIPFGLIGHVIGTRLVHELHGTNDTYTYVVWALWKADPLQGLQQTAVLLLAWVHGCIGLHYWLRLKPWHRRWAPWLLALAAAAPVIALAGFNQMGREVSLLVSNREAWSAIFGGFNLPRDPKAIEALYDVQDRGRLAFLAAIVATVAARYIRKAVLRWRGVVRLTYPNGRTVEIQPGTSVLEASRDAGIPHASVCGGRGRCSTCRVRVGTGAEHLAAPSPEEKRVLTRVAAPPNVRLACQIRPIKALDVTPLLPPNASPRDSFRKADHAHGRDQTVAILFADLRGFTQFSEMKLPYDVVFVLNRYFTLMGEAIAETGGHLDKFIGDGVMALYGTMSDERNGCRAALNGARAMALKLRELNESLKAELPEPLRIGIGIHAGRAIIGEMGYGRVMSLTAIGDAVNTASRLESLTKELAVQLVVSDAVLQFGGFELEGHARHKVAIRGRVEMLGLHAVADAAELAAIDVRMAKPAPEPEPAPAAPAAAPASPGA